MVIALIVNPEGFPLSYEIFDGNRADVTTLEAMVRLVERKYGRARRVWVFDRGIVSEENLALLRRRGGQYLVGTPRSKLRDFERELLAEDWQQVRADVEVKLVPAPGGEETYILCRSMARKQKEQAIRSRFSARMEKALAALEKRVAAGRLRDRSKVERQLGAIQARHPQVADLYELRVIEQNGRLQVQWQVRPQRRSWQQVREGAYLLRTNLAASDPQQLAALSPAFALRDFKGTMRFAPLGITLSNLEGGIAGGRLSGELSLQRNADELSARGRVALTGANADTAFASKKNGVDGQLTFTLQGDGTGLSAIGLIGSLHGSGKIALRDARFAGVDTAAFNAAAHASEDNGPLDAAKIRAAVNAAMEGGRIVVPQADADITMASGQINIANATMRAQGGATLSLRGMLDLKEEAVDANLKLTQPSPANALTQLPPELTIAVRGPLAAPERTLDLRC